MIASVYATFIQEVKVTMLMAMFFSCLSMGYTDTGVRLTATPSAVAEGGTLMLSCSLTGNTSDHAVFYFKNRTSIGSVRLVGSKCQNGGTGKVCFRRCSCNQDGSSFSMNISNVNRSWNKAQVQCHTPRLSDAIEITVTWNTPVGNATPGETSVGNATPGETSVGNAAVIGGSVGTAAGVILVIVVLAVLITRRRHPSTPEATEDESDGANDGMKLNVLYESAGPNYLQQPGPSSRNQPGDMYAVVQKPKSRSKAMETHGNAGVDNSLTGATATDSDMYAQVQKAEKENAEKDADELQIQNKEMPESSVYSEVRKENTAKNE